MADHVKDLSVEQLQGEVRKLQGYCEEWKAELSAAQAALSQAEYALNWYDVHKRDDGSYDGEVFGDLRALTTPESPPVEAEEEGC